MLVLITGVIDLLGGYLLRELQELGQLIRPPVLLTQNSRCGLGYEPNVNMLECIKLATEWFNAGSLALPSITQVSALKGVGKS